VYKKTYNVAQVVGEQISHIVVKRVSYFPWVKSVGTALCGTTRKFYPLKEVESQKLGIIRHKLYMCHECMDIIRDKKQERYEEKKKPNNVLSIAELLEKTKIPEHYGRRRGEKKNGKV
jgi:hypothetical protein